jgi:hypothetical protein
MIRRHTIIGKIKGVVTQILFQIDGNMTGDIVTNSGNVLEWVIEGVTYNQNDVPAHTYLSLGGLGVCSSTDSFQGVTGFRMENCSLVGTLDFSVLNKLTGQLLLGGGNQFSACIFPVLPTPQQITNFRVNNNSEITVIDIRGFDLFPTAVEISGNTKLTNFLYTQSSNTLTALPSISNTPLLTIALDLSWVAAVSSASVSCANSGVTAWKSPTSNSFGTVSADNCDNMVTLDLSGMNGINSTVRAEGCANLETVLFTSTHNAGSIGNWLFNSNPKVTEYNLFNLNFNDTGVFRCSSNTLLNSLIMPNSSTFKRSVLANNCDLSYVDFTNNTSIFAADNIAHLLDNNNMTAAEVNHILVDLAAHVASEGAGGDFIGRSINISGTNAAPDSTSGGFNGTQAVSDLQAKGITVTTS